MYWPIGAPRVYAASNAKPPRNRVQESGDDAGLRENTQDGGSYLDAASNGSEHARPEEEEEPSGVPTPNTTPSLRPVEHETSGRFTFQSFGHDGSRSEPAHKEALLSLGMSRTGHLFAVITSTSLTIWQTKVWTLKHC